MAENSKIEWTHHTLNPWIGCTAVSAACDHCYAEALAKRHGWAEWGSHPRHRTSVTTRRAPLKWDRAAAAAGERHRVFCASLSDIMDNQVPIEWFAEALDVVRLTPNLDWLLLTKRPQNIIKRLAEAAQVATGEFGNWLSSWLYLKPPENVWLGTTAESQAEADRRIPALLAAPAVVHFISAEPLLGPINLRHISTHGGWYDALAGWRDVRESPAPEGQIDWVIAGGESGPNARPMHPAWPRSLRDQCQAAGVAFFFKQWGEWIARGDATDRNASAIFRRPQAEITYDGHDTYHAACHDTYHAACHDWIDEADLYDYTLIRLGKKLTGRLLDGREWNEVPAQVDVGETP